MEACLPGEGEAGPSPCKGPDDSETAGMAFPLPLFCGVDVCGCDCEFDWVKIVKGLISAMLLVFEGSSPGIRRPWGKRLCETKTGKLSSRTGRFEAVEELVFGVRR